jgi:XTP/dITP diphosphohydrolase
LNNGADTLKEANDSVYFATSNRGKYQEAALLATRFGVRLKHLNTAKEEIQADKLTEIASFAASHAAASKRCNVVCEDAGLFVNALDGFPGPYSAYVFRKIGTAGVLKLMRDVANRRASFMAALAYCEPGERPKCFSGVVKGTVSERPKGTHGFGFDPIFVPLGERRTFAEMTSEEKNRFSHRAKAFAKFCKWFTSD